VPQVRARSLGANLGPTVLRGAAGVGFPYAQWPATLVSQRSPKAREQTLERVRVPWQCRRLFSGEHDGTKRTVPLRQWQEVQEMLP